MSTNSTNTASQDVAAAAGADKQHQQQQDTVKKTVQTVEVRSSAGQPDEEGVLKPVRVVHEIPAKEAKENAGAVKQE